MHNINKRQCEIVQMLKRDKFVKSCELAECFGVSIRTIRTDLQYLKKVYPIVTVRGRYAGGIEWVDD